MSVEVLRLWPRQVLVPHSSSKQRCHVSNGGCLGPLVCRFPRKWDRPSLLQRCRSCESSLSISKFMMRRTFPARLFSFSGEDSDDHGSSDTDSCSDDESSDEIDGDGGFNPLNLNYRTILPDGGARLSEQEERMKQRREETSLWISSVEEACEMDGRGLVDREIRKRFVSAIWVEIEPDDDYEDCLSAISTPAAGELCTVSMPHCSRQRQNRAEEYFEKAVMVKEEDAIRDSETLRKYGDFFLAADI